MVKPPKRKGRRSVPPSARGGAPLPPPRRPPFQPVEREKIGAHHAKEEFAVRGKEPKDEIQIFTWKDANLRELTDLIKELAPEARRRDAKLSFALVYPDKNGCFMVRKVGRIFSYRHRRRLDAMKTLAELSFQIGDYLDVAIL